MAGSAQPLPESSQETEFSEFGKQTYKVSLQPIHLPGDMQLAPLEDDDHQSIDDKVLVLPDSMMEEIVRFMITLSRNLYFGKSTLLKALLEKTRSSEHRILYGLGYQQILARTTGIMFALGHVHVAKNSQKP